APRSRASGSGRPRLPPAFDRSGRSTRRAGHPRRSRARERRSTVSRAGLPPTRLRPRLLPRAGARRGADAALSFPQEALQDQRGSQGIYGSEALLLAWAQGAPRLDRLHRGQPLVEPGYWHRQLTAELVDQLARAGDGRPFGPVEVPGESDDEGIDRVVF